VPKATRVPELLAGYLIASGRLAWPGADGLILDEVVSAEYTQAADVGDVPGNAEQARQHPDLAAAVAALLGRSALLGVGDGDVRMDFGGDIGYPTRPRRSGVALLRRELARDSSSSASRPSETPTLVGPVADGEPSV